jgi:FkbM family methyltransferase
MSETYQNQWSEEATVDDIYYCYRLLLGREPGEEGIKFWSQRIANEQFTYAKLSAYFRKSREYVTGMKARGIKLITLPDFDLYLYEHDWDTGEYIDQTRQYEPSVTAFLKRHLKEGMAFVDVGANIGYFTLTAAALVGDSGRTIAVECNPKNCQLLLMSLRRNRFDQVLVYPFAVSDAQKLMSFISGFSNGVVNELAGEAEESVIVPAVTLDFLLQNEPKIDIIKMDIEGSEAKAWQGMQTVIQKHHPIILMEFFPALLQTISGTTTEEFLTSIAARGYRTAVLQPNEDGYYQASSPAEVITAWKKECEVVGESRAYLNLVLHA